MAEAEEIKDSLSTSAPGPLFPPACERAEWERIGSALDPGERAALIARAEVAAAAPVPSLPATLYLDFLRTGRREGYQRPMQQRRQALADLVLAECVEGRSRFADPILDVVWAVCEESSWAYPAHQRELTDGDHPVIDLGAAMTALSLAETAVLVGEVLDPAVAKRIRDEIDRRCFIPYLAREDHHWLRNRPGRPVNNWTAVCTGGVLGAAIHLENDPARLARLITRGLDSLADYLSGFDADGGSSEGPGYWSYGFGYYTLLADLLERRTGGALDLLAGERIGRIARYPLRVQLSPGQYVPFSDCNPEARFSVPHLSYLARRLDVPPLMALAGDQRDGQRGELPWALRSLLWRPEPTQERFTPAAHDWFCGMMWMFSRIDPADPDALVVAAKGGHNGELHNQNDVGSFVVHAGGESLIAELGAGRYTRAYFGPQRYEHLANSSLGHSVPAPAGCAQLPGPEHGATLIEHTHGPRADLLRLELAGAYGPDADLDALERTIRVDRSGTGSVEITDRARFGSPQVLLSAVITFSAVTVAGDSVLIRGERAGLRIGFDPSVVEAQVELLPGVDLTGGPRDVRRIRFRTREPAADHRIRLSIWNCGETPAE